MNELIHCEPGDGLFRQHFPDIEDSSLVVSDGEALPLANRNFVTGLVLLQDGVFAGRLALFHHPEIQYQQQRIMMAGYLNCIAHATVAGILFEEAEKISRNAGLHYLIAPVNATTWNDYRLPLTGDKPLFTGDNSQPLYLHELLSNQGFRIIERYYSSISSLANVIQDAAVLQQSFLKNGIEIRSFNEHHFLDELRLLYPVCNEAFAANPLFSKTSWEDFVDRYRPMQSILDYEHSLMAFDEDQNLLAFMICYPDHHDVSGQTLVLKTIAKNPGKNIPGLMSRMGELLYAKAKSSGYSLIIHAMMHEQNPSLKRSKAFGGKLLRTYGLLGKQL